MRDLEIRGAGNLLGEAQSGHMEAVGYDLYCKMLNEAVLTLKGEQPEEESFETSLELQVDAFIPATYIRSEFQKLDMYKRIAGIENAEEYADLENCLMRLRIYCVWHCLKRKHTVPESHKLCKKRTKFDFI